MEISSYTQTQNDRNEEGGKLVEDLRPFEDF